LLTQPQTSMVLGDIASYYTSLIGTGRRDDADTTFGLRTKPDQPGLFYVGTKPVQIAGNDVIIDDKKYEGTKGLWELTVHNEPNETHITEDDKTKYEDTMISTNAVRRENDPARPKANKSYKYDRWIKPIWVKHKHKKGKGLTAKSVTGASPKRLKGAALHKITNTIYLPSDPNALVDRLDLLLAGKQAGNTGLRNELVAICDELKRLGQLTDGEYKDLNVLINND
jgi:hypothetical protein